MNDKTLENILNWFQKIFDSSFDLGLSILQMFLQICFFVYVIGLFVLPVAIVCLIVKIIFFGW